MKRLVFAPLALLACAAAAQEASSTQQNPRVTFSTPGLKVITLRACNSRGCTDIQKTLTVLDPRPTLASTSAAPATIPLGDLVVLSARATGRPELRYTWTLRRGSTVLATLLGNPATWSPAPTLPLGAVTVDLRVANVDGAATATTGFTVVANPPRSFFTVTPCRLLDTRNSAPLTARAPSLTTTVTAANCGIPPNATAIAANLTAVTPSVGGWITAYPGDYPDPPISSNLNFNAGKTRAAFSILPIARDGSGRYTLRTYLNSSGEVHVLLDVSGYFIDDAALAPVASLFSASLCSAGFCIFPTNANLFFDIALSGSPTSYTYDWDGNNTFEETSSTPINSHVFSTATTITPRFRATRGTLSSTIAHPLPITLIAANLSMRPATPTAPSIAFARYEPRANDPRFGTALAAVFNVSTPPNELDQLLGYNLWLTNGLSRRLAGTLPPSGLGTLAVLATDAQTASLRLDLTALSIFAESFPSTSVAMPRP